MPQPLTSVGGGATVCPQAHWGRGCPQGGLSSRWAGALGAHEGNVATWGGGVPGPGESLLPPAPSSPTRGPRLAAQGRKGPHTATPGALPQTLDWARACCPPSCSEARLLPPCPLSEPSPIQLVCPPWDPELSETRERPDVVGSPVPSGTYGGLLLWSLASFVLCHNPTSGGSVAWGPHLPLRPAPSSSPHTSTGPSPWVHAGHTTEVSTPQSGV